MWWPWKRSTSPDELTEKTMGLIRDRLRKTPDHPFRPWTSETTSSDAVRAKGALDRVREETPSSEHVYFDTSRAPTIS